MLKNLPYPIIYVLEIIIIVPLMSGFIAMVSFIGSKPLDSLDLHGKSLPSNWEAAVPNHGKFLPGYLISKHPIMFAAIVVLFVGSLAMSQKLRKAHKEQITNAKQSDKSKHTIANYVVFAIWFLSIYVLVTHILVGVSPT